MILGFSCPPPPNFGDIFENERVVFKTTTIFIKFCSINSKSYNQTFKGTFKTFQFENSIPICVSSLLEKILKILQFNTLKRKKFFKSNFSLVWILNLWEKARYFLACKITYSPGWKFSRYCTQCPFSYRFGELRLVCRGRLVTVHCTETGFWPFECSSNLWLVANILWCKILHRYIIFYCYHTCAAYIFAIFQKPRACN